MTLHSNHGNNRDTSTIHGKKIQVNGKELALFCYKDKFYAVNEKCPHLGMCLLCNNRHAVCYACLKVYVKYNVIASGIYVYVKNRAVW